MKRNILPLLLLAMSMPVFFSSCISGSALQTARTVGKGNSETNVGFSMVNYEFVTGESNDTISASAPLLEVDFRYGIAENLDLGARLSLLGTSGLYAKYQFLGDTKSMLAGSAGLNISYLQLSVGSGADEATFTVIDFSIPAYFSVHPTSWLGVYVSPRYTLRSAGGISHWYGGSSGLRLGNRVGAFFEYSLFAGSSATKALTQVTGGISVRF